MREFVAPSDDFRRRHGANLPHWRQARATYFVTFRLADSLPAGLLDQCIRERDALLVGARVHRNAEAVREIERDYLVKIHALMDKGFGAAWMNRPEVADCVAGAIRFFEGTRYDLWAWCVMPNHVHVVVQPAAGVELGKILHSWRSFTANQINELVGRQGQVWQLEPFDHVVRSVNHLRRFITYTVGNPQKAGLREWRWVWGVDVGEVG